MLPPATMNLEVVIASGPAAIDAIHLVTDLVATLLPAMQRVGVATPSEVELPTLSHRIAAEVEARYLDWPVGSGCLDEAVTPHAGNSQQPERAQIASSPCSSQ